MYKLLIKPFLGLYSAERARRIALTELKIVHRLPLTRSLIRLAHRKETPALKRELFGIEFPNPVGLAAGFDTDGEFAAAIADYGFGFIEIGSITAAPEEGNPRPRIFRLPKDNAIIHRTGTANKGVIKAIQNIQAERPDCILAVNLANSPLCTKDSKMINDFQYSFSMMYDFADMFTINVSNTDRNGVLSIQNATSIAEIIDPLVEMRLSYENYKPILLKISPDIPRDELCIILNYCMYSGVDGIIAAGSSRKLPELQSSQRRLEDIGPGGLSGAPLYEKSLELVRFIHEYTKGRFPIIGCGGICKAEQVEEMLSAGASLVQMHSAFAYEGPGLIKKIIKKLDSKKQ